MASSRPPEGYPRLAACMKESPEIAIFRRFGDLNVQNLLYLQSELNHMLEDYRDIVQEDYDSKDPKREVLSRRWIELSRSRGDQWEKWLDIRSKLEHYNQVLIQTSQLFQYSSPAQRQLDTLRKWLRNPREGCSFLRGSDVYIWDSRYEDDLISLPKDACQDDAFSNWLAGYPLTAFHHYLGAKIWKLRRADEESIEEKPGFVRYNYTKLSRLSYGLATGLASLFVVTSVIVLNSITATLIRLMAITIFAFVFSLLMFVFTNARKIEVFAATCAFASVQVVFVGTSS